MWEAWEARLRISLEERHSSKKAAPPGSRSRPIRSSTACGRCSPHARARMRTVSECVFCDIVADGEAAARVREDGMTVAFIPLQPATDGHVLVVPKRHARNLFDIQHEDLAAVAAAAKEISLWQRERLRCTGVSVFQANESDGFQSVFHYHVHVVPRYPGDRLVPSWTSPVLPLPEREAMARRLRGDGT